MQPVCNLWMVMADSIKIRIPTFSQEAVLREKKKKMKWGWWEGVRGGGEEGKKKLHNLLCFCYDCKVC